MHFAYHQPSLTPKHSTVMLFNSFEFLLFLPIVFLLYWFATNRNLKLQNALVVVASYLFYGW